MNNTNPQLKSDSPRVAQYPGGVKAAEADVKPVP